MSSSLRPVSLISILLFAACGPDRTTTIPKLTGDAAAGKVLFESTATPKACADCHKKDGVGDSAKKYPDLHEPAKNDSVAELSGAILLGEGDMPAFESTLTDQNIADIIAYLKSAFGT